MTQISLLPQISIWIKLFNRRSHSSFPKRFIDQSSSHSHLLCRSPPAPSTCRFFSIVFIPTRACCVKIVSAQNKLNKHPLFAKSKTSFYFYDFCRDCGKQVYLGGFDTAYATARAYDREDDLNQIKNLTKEEFMHLLRRQSTGFSRGSSKYRGVTLHKCGRWEARMGQFVGKKYIYLGLFDSKGSSKMHCEQYKDNNVEKKSRLRI
ncbi:unnamed protein product [Lactuca saligna]|uniref:AP2/ERF domain-containing protein n=1 Tax=Lactuca saligna TaxID=75948 RepID=A0AA36E0M3_LACSI|nr:unnamed protein product [Lactuca saligna]